MNHEVFTIIYRDFKSRPPGEVISRIKGDFLDNYFRYGLTYGEKVRL